MPPGLNTIHEDRDIIVVDKPAGMLTMATETEKTRTAYYALTDYVRKGTASFKEVFCCLLRKSASPLHNPAHLIILDSSPDNS